MDIENGSTDLNQEQINPDMLTEFVNGLQDILGEEVTMFPTKYMFQTQNQNQTQYNNQNQTQYNNQNQNQYNNQNQNQNNTQNSNQIKNENEVSQPEKQAPTDKLEELFSEYQIPILFSLIYFIFQLPIYKQIIITYLPILLDSSKENFKLSGYIFTSILVGMVYYILYKSINYLF